MKRRILALSIAAAFISSAHATGVPTVDVVANALSIEHEVARVGDAAKQIAELKNQLDVLRNQYDTLKSQLEAVRGNYGYGAVRLVESLEGAKIVPGSWQDVVAQQAQGRYGSNLARAEALLQTIPKDEFKDQRKGEGYASSSNAVRSSMAAAEALYTEAQTHLLAIERLSKEVDKTENIKAAADLQNRFEVERGLLAAANLKMNAIQLNLQANAQNAQNQATALNQRYVWTVAK